MGRNAILAGEATVVVAGGMESMTNAPHLVDLRKGHKYGAAGLKDHMATDGLEDAYGGGAMGNFADMIAKEYQFTREQQDAYALETLSARAGRHQGRPLQARDRAGHRQRQEGRRHDRHGRAAAQRDAGKDSAR